MSNPYQNLQLPHSPIPQSQPSAAQHGGSQGIPNQQQLQQAQQAQIEESLSQLSDIHLPPAVKFWPPAPGWWIATFLSILLIFFLLRFLRRKLIRLKQVRRTKKQIQHELELISQDWKNDSNIILTAAELSQVLRRYSVFIFPNDNLAAEDHYQLLQQFEKQFKLNDFSKTYYPLFDGLAYQDPQIVFDTQEQQQLSEKINTLIPLLKKLMSKALRKKRFDKKEIKNSQVQRSANDV